MGAIATGVAACGGPGSSSGKSSSVIKVGTVPALYWAAWTAMPDALKDANSSVKVEKVNFKSSADVFVALQSGDIQMASMGMNVMASGLASNASLPISMVAGLSPGRSQVLFRNGSGITGWKDVKGRNVGIIRGSTDELIFKIALAKNGIDMATDTKVTTFQAAADLLLAIRKGAVDAVVTYQPNTAQAVAQGIATAPKDVNDQLTEWASVPSDLFARDELIKDNPEAVQEIVGQFVKTTESFSDHKTWVNTTLKYQTGDAKLLTQALVGSKPWYQMQQAPHREMAAAMAEYKTVSKDVGDQLVKIMNYDFLKKATGQTAQQLGASEEG